MADAAASHAEEEADQLYKAHLAIAGKVLSRVFDKLGSVTGHSVHDCPKCGFDLLRE